MKTILLVGLLLPIMGCASELRLNHCAQRMKEIYENEQRKILKSTRRKDLPNIDAFSWAQNGETSSRARLHFFSGGYRSPKVWAIDYTCRVEEQEQRYIKRGSG